MSGTGEQGYRRARVKSPTPLLTRHAFKEDVPNREKSQRKKPTVRNPIFRIGCGARARPLSWIASSGSRVGFLEYPSSIGAWDVRSADVHEVRKRAF